jgi:hypothetical protein
MIWKVFKVAAASTAAAFLVGGLVFGKELSSYISSSARAVQCSVKDNVPIEFQLQRARDLVDDIVPEIQANVKQIATQEVEIDSLRHDIQQSNQNISDEKKRIAKLRDCLASSDTSFTISNCVYTRDQLKEDLGRRFDYAKEAEVVLTGKKRLLDNREKSLTSAMQALDHASSQKSMLESQIAALEGQNQLVKASSAGSNAIVDNSKLAQSQKLIDDIKKQLDVAERVLAHQSRFVDPIRIDVVSDKDLVSQVDDFLKDGAKAQTASAN